MSGRITRREAWEQMQQLALQRAGNGFSLEIILSGDRTGWPSEMRDEAQRFNAVLVERCRPGCRARVVLSR